MAVTSTNFSIDIVKEVLQSRTNLNIRNASDGELENLICEADKYLKNHVIFSLNVWLIIASPNEGNTESDKTQEVEVWMFKPYADSAQPGDAAAVQPIFLKQAIRSQLHFSQLKSFTSTLGDDERRLFKLTLKLSTFLPNSEPPQKDDADYGFHQFPVCCSGNCRLSVTFQCLKREHISDAFIVSPTCRSSKPSTPCWQSVPSTTEAEVKGNKASRRLDGPAFITDGILDLCLDSDQEVSKLTNSTKWPFHHKSPNFQQSKDNYHPRIRLPMNSSPAPPLNTVRRRLADANNRNQLERKYASSAKLRDVDVCESGSEKKSHQYGRLDDNSVEDNIDLDLRAMTTLKAARLLCNFEESALNGCLQPASSVNGFKLQFVTGIPATSCSQPSHSCILSSRIRSQRVCFSNNVTLPVRTYYFNSTDTANGEIPSLHMGYCNLVNPVTIPKRCTIQAVLFNPQGSVIKIFLVDVDVSDMPSNHRTFVRQRTFSGDDVTTTTMDANDSTISSPNMIRKSPNASPNKLNSKLLRFLIHFWILSDSKGNAFLHSDIRILFSNKANDLEGLENAFKEKTGSKGTEQLQTVCEMPSEPKYSQYTVLNT